MGVIPAGQYHCPSCFCRRDFIVAPEASPDEAAPAIECWVCGYTYARVVREVDPVTGIRLAPNLAVSQAIPQEVREEAKAKMRIEFRDAVLRDGVRRENFSGVYRRTVRKKLVGG
jgi:hypothetical protein